MRRAVGYIPVVEATSLVVARQRPGERRRVREERAKWRARYGRGHWTAMDLGFLTLLFGITMLNVLDIAITLFHTGNHGWGVEGNPLIRVLAESGGEVTAVFFKLALIALALTVMWRLYRLAGFSLSAARHKEGSQRATAVHRVQITATLVLLALYLWVVQHNLRIVWS
jgi:hypothetical protein